MGEFTELVVKRKDGVRLLRIGCNLGFVVSDNENRLARVDVMERSCCCR